MSTKDTIFDLFVRQGRLLVFLAVLVFSSVIYSSSAQAFRCICAPCVGSCVHGAHEGTRSSIASQHGGTQAHISMEFQNQKMWILNTFFMQEILPTMQSIADQLVTASMQKMFMIGTFFDAKQQLEAERHIQFKTAEAYKDYHPSVGMCKFGTLGRSFASADRNVDFNTYAMMQRSQDRQLAIKNMAAEFEQTEDRRYRLQQFKKRYCDPNDGNLEYAAICRGTREADGRFVNRDIDFTGLLGNAKNLDVDFTDASISDDEQDLLALASNIFSHDVLARTLDDNKQQDYLDMRSLVAKRSVAENSFYSLVGLKSKGAQTSAETAQYMQAVLRSMGMSDSGQLAASVGDRPSYYAMLELLGQKLYQDPAFFTNLYDKPANVERQNVAMQAIDLMMNRDKYKSELRSEAVLAVLLELELGERYNEAQQAMDKLENNKK